MGAVFGLALAALFEGLHARGRTLRGSMKVILVLGCAFLLLSIETWVKPWVALSGLLAVVSMACVLKRRCPEPVSRRLGEKFGKLWLAAEVVLFVLVGAAVDIRYTLRAAIGSVPLSLGLPCGDMVLSTAVLGILIIAPLGAFAIDWGAPRLLTQEKEPS